MLTSSHGLGRLYAPDPRDRFHPMAAVLPAATARTIRYWNDSGWWGDQGQTPECVAFSTMHWLADGPITHPKRPFEDPDRFFTEIGGGPDGAVVRDAFKRLQALGVVGSYHWATRIEDVDVALLEVGPVVIGIDWYEEMFSPDPRGFVTPGGQVAGGHAIEVNGIVAGHHYRLKNSWGRGWGHSGHCFVARDVFEYLVFGANGEACLATEIRG
jgi:hypothetical protein